MNEKLANYNRLLDLSYEEMVLHLLNKYGGSKDDYFREQSYERFLKKEIKSITKGKCARTAEGLFCHHVAENCYLNLANKEFILENQYPFTLHTKDKLVFCDLFEHLILHALIAKETNGEFGLPGYLTYIYPMIIEWYVGQRKPQKKEWMKTCYEQAYLSPKETKQLLTTVNLLLPLRFQNKKEIVYVSPEEISKQMSENKKKREKEYKGYMENQRIQEIKIREERTKDFYREYPDFEKLDITFDSSRKKIIAMLYDLDYSTEFQNKRELEKAMKPVIKDTLLEQLYSAVSNKKRLI
ncbi:hypothetical protein ADIAL_0017 [Alkalibacterium sp. AK22]|uniref:hypothetical protein n=1 Tax=Alkalibacterium sp. AK22 TaxID=1229520 RepID=UPI0004465B2A|nr:hypothetical protein [Alkalibacterium sp. AK22]EXJ24502.1 hypothetical protein ADIAL_0017 [Alkalibacterium sp. AK22]